MKGANQVSHLLTMCLVEHRVPLAWGCRRPGARLLTRLSRSIASLSTCAHNNTSKIHGAAEHQSEVRTHNALDTPQGAPGTYVIAGIDVRASADLWGGTGERKELPGHRPGRPEAELRRPERRSGSDRAGQERGVRAAARLGARACQMPRPARAPAACSAAVPRRGGRPRCISAGRA